MFERFAETESQPNPNAYVEGDATTWPFAGFANDGVAPLLLPWQDEARRYRYADGAMITP